MDHESTAVVARAESLFAEGYSCSQAVLIACAPHVALEPDVAARLASAFGGGMARHGWTCGALTGAMLALGLQHRCTAPGDSPQKDATYAAVAALVERFRSTHGATECSRLIGYQLSDSVQRQAAKEAGVFVRLCPGFVRTAAAFVAEGIVPGRP